MKTHHFQFHNAIPPWHIDITQIKTLPSDPQSHICAQTIHCRCHVNRYNSLTCYGVLVFADNDRANERRERFKCWEQVEMEAKHFRNMSKVIVAESTFLEVT
uniref:Uncharacterized protein n=1 Tax=Tanacetum cinerariifolium TaxID=118510 RepID=A0A6L2MSU4_TANCI|nr:hypothetical protein [Tanacetum cinerariifolium]